jgi:putative transposase
MTRPLRIEFPGAVYHVTSRGDRRESIFLDDTDRQALLAVLGSGLTRYNAQMLAYCLMGNHYHFVLHTRAANLSLLMRHINGVYTQSYNRRHGVVGHLLQGRFKAILVDRDAYLLEVCRYVELNAVRAGLVQKAGDWAWSSYCAHIGQALSPKWLDTVGLHGYLLGRAPMNANDSRRAAHQYAALVDAGLGVKLWEAALNRQIYLGDDDFVARMQAQDARACGNDRNIPKPQRTKAKTLDDWLSLCNSREEALRRAHVDSGIRMTTLAKSLGLTVARVSQLIARAERVETERSAP